MTEKAAIVTRQSRWAGRGAIAAGVLVMAAALALALFWAQPPAPRAESAPADDFSAVRAMEVVARLLDDEAPHPVGTDANARVAVRIIDELGEIGIQAETQETFACSSMWAQCGTVVNVLARLPGETSGPAVLLTAHYDSVPAGPGAADDAAGVAAMLEIARILASAPAARNPVIFLFSDGEEPGLLGAEAFMAEHRWAGDIGAVVNLEANGTRGQSILFETSENNGWLIDAFAAEAPRPVANSLFYEIYRNLPHNSDLTVYKRAGLPGVNFAFTEGGGLYHTPLDNFANLDPASVQHHGDNALAAVRAFAARDLAAPPQGNAVFMDLLPGTVLRWPEPWTPWIAAACVLVWIGIAFRLVGLRETSLAELLLGWLVLPLGLVAASVAGYAVTFTLSRAAGALMPWYATPLPTRVALWSIELLSLAVVSLLIGERAKWWGTALGIWWWWAILSLLAAWMLPGASVIFLLPAAPALLALAVVAWSPLHASAGARAAAAFVGLFVASWFWLAFAISAETLGLAAELGAFVASAAVLAAGGMVPFFSVLGLRDRGTHLALWGLAVAAAVAYVAALQVPVYSAAAPQRLNVVHIEDRSAGEAYWALDGEIVSADGRADVPEALAAAARFDEALVPLLPWSETRLLVAPAPTTDAPAPTVRVLDDRIVDGERALTIELLSPRRGEQLSLYVPEREGLRRIDVNGTGRTIETFALEKGYQSFRCFGVTCDGLELTLTLSDPEGLSLLVADTSPELPPDGGALLNARPPTAQSSHNGDRSLLFTWVAVDAAPGG